MKSQRDAFFDRLYELACEDRNIVIMSDDQGAPSLDKWRANLGSQWVPVGIAEQNAITIAAGLALEGKKVFVYALLSFCLRCYEQIKVTLCAMNVPVTIVGVGAGFSYAEAGPTHHAVEDIAAMRCLPNLTIHNTTDAVMAAAFAEISVGWEGPNYVRLDRQKFPPIYGVISSLGAYYKLGLAGLAAPTDKCIIATGNMVHRALAVARDIKVGVIDVFALPINEERLYAFVKDCTQLYTLEEHVLPGGLGSAVCEFVADYALNTPVCRLGLDMRDGYCYQYGGREHLQSLYGLDERAIKEVLLGWT